MSEEQIIEIAEEEIQEAPQPEPFTDQALKDGGLSTQEIAKAKEMGLIPEEKEEKTEEVDEKPKEEKVDIKEEVEETPKEELKVDESQDVQKLVKEKQAMYHQMKDERKSRQDIENKMAEMEKKIIDASVVNNRINQAISTLNSPDVTVEQLQSILQGEQKQEGVSDENKPLTVADFKRIEEEKVQQTQKVQADQQAKVDRFNKVMEFGRDTNKQFDDIVKKVYEFSSLQNNAIYDNIISEALLNPSIAEEQVAEMIVQVARLTPEGAALLNGQAPQTQKSSESEKTDAQRAIENSQKSPSSASVAGAGSRKISLNDLKPEDIAKMSSDQWVKVRKKLSKSQREKLLNFDL